MNQQPIIVPPNRIANSLNSWERVENKLAERYGRKILQDRDFLKAKRDIYQHIRDKYKGNPLNLYEKAEMRVLRSQHRNMLRQIYPNPAVRLLRNLAVFTGNLINAGAATIMAGGKALLTPSQQPAVVYNLARKEPVLAKTSVQQPKQQTKSTQKPGAKKSGTTQSVPIVRKIPTKTRVTIPAASKGMRK